MSEPPAPCAAGRHQRAPTTTGDCCACGADDALVELAVVLHELLPAADEGVLADIAGGVIQTGDARRRVTAHLRSHPEAMSSGGSMGPLAWEKVAHALADAGLDAVTRPSCVTCGRPTRRFQTVEATGRQCVSCRQAARPEACHDCGRTRRVRARVDRGPLCQQCWA